MNYREVREPASVRACALRPAQVPGGRPSVELDRLRKRVAFERFLARLFGRASSRWVLKGSYALELRLGGKARATKDIDLDLPPPPVEDLLDEL